MNDWKAISAVLIVFSAGALSGAMGTHLYLSRLPQAPAAPAPGVANRPAAPWMAQRVNFLRRIGHQLDLTPEQHARIDRILDQSQERMRALWGSIAPQMKEETHNVRKQIEAELTPQQRQTFEQLLKAHPSRPPNGRPEQRPHERRENGSPFGPKPDPNSSSNSVLPTAPAESASPSAAPR